MTGAWVFFGAVVVLALCVLAWIIGTRLKQVHELHEPDPLIAEREAAEHAAPHEPHVDGLTLIDDAELREVFPQNEHARR